jgi:D-alanyl-D-alanine carboxypeptidase
MSAAHLIECVENRAFASAWTTFINDDQLAHATYSITVLNETDGRLIFGHNTNVGLSPASTMKTVTGAAAFHYLGENYRYRTLLQYSGAINASGFLDGFIYLVGKTFALMINEDPIDDSLNMDTFRQWRSNSW